MRAYMSRLPRRVRDFVRSQAAEEKPNIREVRKAGRLLGLDEEDISSLVHRKGSSDGFSFIEMHWMLILLLVGFGTVILLLMWLLSSYQSHGLGSIYPSGTYYGVIGPKDFEKGASPLKTRNNP